MGRKTLPLAVACLAGTLLARTAPTGSVPNWDEVCRGALAGRRGAVVLVELPSGAMLHVQNRDEARKKFEGSSIYKPLAAYALLREKAVRPEEAYTSRKSIRVERYGVTLEAPYDADGKVLDLAHALSESNNGYFYTRGQRLDVEVWLRYYRDLGLGSCVRSPKTPREEAELPAHGGACVRASTLDLAPYLRRLATDPSPEMVAVRGALRLAVEEGTGKPATVQGLAVCGKTGWLRGAGRFLGFAPESSPRFGVIVTLPGATGGDAAAVAGAVFKAWWAAGGKG